MQLYTSVVPIVLKWWKKLTTGPNPVSFRPNLLIILLYVMLILSGIYIYRQWTDIPLRTINLDMYELDPSSYARDTVYAYIDVNLDLYRTQSRIKSHKRKRNRTLVNVYFREKNPIPVSEKGKNYFLKNIVNSSDTSRNSARARGVYYKLSSFNDTIKNKADSIDICGLRHMVVFDIKAEGVAPSLCVLSTDNNHNNVLIASKDLIVYNDTSYINLKGHFFKPDIELKTGLIYGFDSGTESAGLQYGNSLFSSPFSMTRLEDISQQYLCVKINRINPDKRWGDSNLEVRNLAINTVGASDIKCKTTISPFEEDTVICTPRMDGVDIKGNVEEVLLYIESKEGSSLQSLRLFFLTTMMAFVITLLLSSLFSLYRSYKAQRRKSNPTLTDK